MGRDQKREAGSVVCGATRIKTAGTSTARAKKEGRRMSMTNERGEMAQTFVCTLFDTKKSVRLELDVADIVVAVEVFDVTTVTFTSSASGTIWLPLVASVSCTVFSGHNYSLRVGIGNE